MKMFRALALPTATIAMYAITTGCGVSDDETPVERQPAPDGPIQAAVTHAASAPFAATTGDFAFASPDLGVGSTGTGLMLVETDGENAGKPPRGFVEWSLTSTGAGSAVFGVAVSPAGALSDGPYAFFLPTGRPEVGAVRIGSVAAQGELLGESVLAEDLVSSFPSAIEAPAVGPASAGIWVVDAVFGPGSSVKSYPYSGWNAATKKLSERASARFTPRASDADHDGADDLTTLNRLTFADEGRVGLVSFSFLAPGPSGAAGGVYAFDSTSGAELGRIIMPVTSSVAGALEFVQSVRATNDYVVVISAVKSSSFEDIGGRVAVYRVRSWAPFQIDDADGQAPYDQPESLIATHTPNAVGLGIRGSRALVVCAPFAGSGELEIVDLSTTPARRESTYRLGALFTVGYNVPSDPKVSPSGGQALIGTEAGLLRVEFN